MSKKIYFYFWTFLWSIIDTFVNILVMIAVVMLLAERINGLLLSFMVVIFILWAFRPMYLAFREFLRGTKENVKEIR